MHDGKAHDGAPRVHQDMLVVYICVNFYFTILLEIKSLNNK